MSRPESALMRRIVLITLTTLASGCAIGNRAAICDGTVSLRDTHADALLADGGGLSVQTGAALISAIDAACG